MTADAHVARAQALALPQFRTSPSSSGSIDDVHCALSSPSSQDSIKLLLALPLPLQSQHINIALFVSRSGDLHVSKPLAYSSRNADSQRSRLRQLWRKRRISPY
jgi:hypothetical protein